MDRIDRQIVSLISERSDYVAQAARFKKDTEEVKAPDRVEAVIGKVRTLAEQNNVSPSLIEQVYRTMIACFIEEELDEHSKIIQEKKA
ncbi:chorismate mutase [Niallia sp. 03133]|uniref:chorismate mutase n=1 Tax=Niallia sp. 03133 TaxID=3458060 RepID=UPI004044F488